MSITLDIDINDTEIEALAQFLKRVSFSDIQLNAVDEDEAYLMRDSLSKLQDSLALKGYSPR